MKLEKIMYVHNYLRLEEHERDTLNSAVKIVSNIRHQNIHSCGAEDEYLTEVCDAINRCITELINEYSNQYYDKKSGGNENET